MIEELIRYWNSDFKNVAPEADSLKHECKTRWVRFHSLPESKRYPESEAEYLEVFRRHNVVLQELCVNERKALVILPEYSEKKVPIKPEPEFSGLFQKSEPWCTLKQHEDDDDYESFCHLHVSAIQFTGNEFNDLFRMVANDEVRNIMIISPSKGFVFHPYDGGADVVLESTEKRDQIKEKHKEWLSARPDGF